MRVADPLLALALLSLAAPAAAAGETSFDIPAGTLAGSLAALGGQAHITIVANDPALSRLRSRPVRGRMSARAALGRLLAGTGYTFVEVASGAIRIVAAPRPLGPKPRPAPPPAPAAISGPPSAPQEIVVTASKQGVPLFELAATARIVDLSEEDGARRGGRGSEAVVSRLPMLASTSLGPGRNKIYIRGIADSSFNGPSQSIVGQYLGDVRLTFNAPDPDLRLYDMRSVELLEGPQGTLYGSGSLGGILRLVPNPPDLSALGGAISGGASSTRHGAAGGDAALTLNLPLVDERLGLRAVGYSVSEGGWIDDLGRGLRDVNRTRIRGGRASLLYAPGGGWAVEAGGVAQLIGGRDGQYAERGLTPLTRVGHVPQPFDNDYLLGELTVRRRWNGLELVSATNVVDHALDSRFDATGGPGIAGVQLFGEDVHIRMIAHETRLSRSTGEGRGWIAGFSFVRDLSRIERRLGPPSAPAPSTGVRTSIDEGALFGQAGVGVAPGIVLTAGGRATWSRNAGSLLSAPDREENEPTRTGLRLSPTLALSWRLPGRFLLYARYQDAYRAGGLAVAPAGPQAARRFKPDELGSAEAGLRYGAPTSPFSADLAVSYTKWTDIQADLIDRNGLPFTTNIGSGRVYALEGHAAWRPAPWIALDAAAFLADSALRSSAAPVVAADERSLPDIAEAGGRAGVRLERRLGPSARIGLDASVRYVGRSRLAVGAPLDIPQGDYVVGDVGARLGLGRFGIALDVENATDARGNRFSYGNPFTVADRTQSTPLRPRTIRLGLDLAF
ncbi:MAG: TonB-dependent receptor [Alphaproteobacteria bacterium]|nr:TonB-dependent receptor [Alphaproteobacteria bacterium]MBV9370081.1 TonB-dependent receptor [Alphaproteobacteria bacterium]MBV9900755.1 TonB-dependent receptor [Alphaproteobacteria bacterium]